MGNIETTMEFSRLKSIYFYFSNLFIFKSLFTVSKENYHPSLRRKCVLKMDFKKSKFLIVCFPAFSLHL